MFNEFHDEVAREELYEIYGEHNMLDDDELDALEEERERDFDDSMDGDHASGLASAGWGTDEDYRYDTFESESDLWNEF